MRSEAMGKTMAIFMVMAMIATGIATLIPNVTAAGDPVITGTVLSSVSPYSPIKDVAVKYTGNDTKTATAYTDQYGKFTLNVYNGSKTVNFTLDFTKDGYGVRQRTFTNPVFNGDEFKTNNTLMVPDPTVSGTVLDKESMPLGDVFVNIINKTGGWKIIEEVKTGIDGKFSCQVSSDVPEIDIYYKKTGYYSVITEDIDVEDGKDLGEIFLEEIVPAPTVKVWGYVLNENNTDEPLPGALVSISEGNDKWITALSNEKGYYEMWASPNNYQVKTSCSGYYTKVDSVWLNVPSDKTSVKRNILLEKTPVPNRKVSGTISNSTGAIKATVILHSNDARYENATTANETGFYEIGFYAPGKYTLEVRMEGYYTDASVTSITGNLGDETYNIQLIEIGHDYTLRGCVYDFESDNLIVGATVQIFDKNTSRIYSVSTVTDDEGYYEFSVSKNSYFAILVNAIGFQSELVPDVGITTSDRYVEVGLYPSGTDKITTTFTFTDWNNIAVTKNSVISVDNISVRFEADRMFGMGDLYLKNNDRTLNVTEIGQWATYLKNRGLEKRNTKEFLTLNNTYYQLNATSYAVTIQGASGSIAVDTTIYITSSYRYTLVGTLENPNSKIFELGFNATYDTEFIDYTNNIILPLAPVKFEMTENITETNNAEVTGYNNPITIDPMVHVGDLEEIVMTVERSMNGTAKAEIISGVHYVLNNTYDNYTVIVARGPSGGTNTTVKFSAEDSTDQIGDIGKANFTWDFGDGQMGYGLRVEHNYTVATIDGEVVVKLVVTETGGNTTYRNITVFIDSCDSVAKISADITDSENVTFDATTNTLTVNEDFPVTFSGLAFTDTEGVIGVQTIIGGTSTDDIKSGDGEGIIDKWYWSWGEEESFDETITKDGSNNITHTYSEPGTYTINMITTDVVDRESATNATWNVKVLDITAPVADFKMHDLELANLVVTEVLENRAYSYNASITTDNYDDVENLTFEWFFNDETVPKTGMAVEYTFTIVGQFNVTLKATDQAGNSQNKTTLVYVNLNSRPNILMKLGSLVFSSTPGTAGKAMTISVNITNDGQSNATDITTIFYIRNSDGTDKEIGTATTSSLAIAETKTVSISWTPNKKGEYSIWANSTCAGEHSSQWWDNKIDDFNVQKVTVDEAAWVMPVIIVAIVVIIIVVFLGMRHFMKSGTTEEASGEKRKKR